MAAPMLLRSALASVKGLQVERARRGQAYHAVRRELRERRHWDGAAFAAHRDRLIVATVRNAARFVPFYREVFRERGMSPDDFATAADLDRLPVVDKGTVREDPDRFVDERSPRRGRMVLHTTGTSGTPLRIVTDRAARQVNYAFFDDYLASFGIGPRDRRATIGGRVVAPADRDRPPFWVHSWYQRTLFMSSYHLSAANISHYIRALRRFQPKFIDAYPSSCHAMARWMLDEGIRDIRVQAVLTSSETLFPEQRAAIEAAFGCPVFDQYGAAEMCVFVGQCGTGRYHLRPDYGHVEILSNGAPAPPGHEGELVCTGFVNPVMPLIRYRIGDVGMWSAEECPCGLATPLLHRVIGREDDVIRTPDGRAIGRLSPVLKGFPLLEAQFVQDALNHLTLRLAPAPGYRPAHTAQIVEEVRKRVPSSMHITPEFVTHIPRGPGGKFRAVVSLVSSSGG